MADLKSEHYELKRLGAIPTPNSGRGYHKKGDGIIYSPTGDALFTVDVKENGRVLSLNKDMWIKATTDAKSNNTEPLLKPVLGTEEPKTRLVVMSEMMFEEMYEAWEEKYYGREH